MKVEVFQAIACKSCADSREALRAVAENAVPGLVWRDVDVTEELDYAAAVGVLGIPALAVDGELVFSSLPTPAQLVAELQRRVHGKSNGR